MDENNVITFPKLKLNSPPQSAKELAEQIEEFKIGHSDQIAEVIWQYVLAEIVRSGATFDKDTLEYFPSMVLILEAIKSLLLLTNGIDHPLQDFAKDSIDLEQFSEEMDLLVDNEEDLD